MASMKRLVLKRLFVLALVAVIGCKSGPSEDTCKQLLDHLVDLEFKKAGAAANSDSLKAEIAKQKAAVTEAKAGEFIKACTDKMAKSRVDCALAANDLDGDSGVAKCDEAK
jgi:hypothetical protein